MGGVWERQIRTVRSVLSALLQSNGSQLDDELLRTLMCETEAIVNSRPLTVNDLNDPDSLQPLTPSHLLTMKSRVTFHHLVFFSRLMILEETLEKSTTFG
jgi:hypothetical protein